jgi:hypothetical protein
MAVTCSLAGCATLQAKRASLVNNYTQSQNLSEARRLLAKGDHEAAFRVLADICAAPAAEWVTDEALFRLAILSLGRGGEKEGETQAVQPLMRLEREYPKSPWSAQSAPLTDLLARTEELRRQNRNLRSHNQSLVKENKELLQSIEKLKRLDMELEKKNR